MFVSNKNSYENEARAISYKNAQEALKDNKNIKAQVLMLLMGIG